MWCKHPFIPSLQQEFFTNIKMSNRGSIRKNASIVTWATSLMFLRNHGGVRDPGSVIRSWNSQSARSSQINGQRAQALKMLLEFPKPALDRLIQCVSTLGWESCPFSEDSLSSKKLLPPFIFRKTADDKWTARGAVSMESVVLMTNHICFAAEHAPVMVYKKLDKPTIEKLAEVAAVVKNLGDEVLANYPISMDRIYQDFLRPWQENTPGLHSTVLVLVNEKPRDFNIRDVPVLKQLVERHHASLQSQHVPSSESIASSLSNIEASSWSLFREQFTYDTAVAKVFLEKLSNFDCTVDTKKREWRMRTWDHSKALLHSLGLSCSLADPSLINVNVSCHTFLLLFGRLLPSTSWRRTVYFSRTTTCSRTTTPGQSSTSSLTTPSSSTSAPTKWSPPWYLHVCLFSAFFP